MKVTLLDSLASDLSVVHAARVSLDKWNEEWTNNHGLLINFLMKNHHGTPFEHNYFRVHVEAPIFVFREWHRHRIGHSYNEVSGRYVELEEKFYVPETLRTQRGKPGAYFFEDTPESDMTRAIKDAMDGQNRQAFELYRELLAAGVAKEQARTVLPVATYTQMIWSCNARSLMAFLSLRAEEHAMKEIRDLAYQAEADFMEVMPWTWDAWHLNGRVAP
jgi:thymidylate synthase (FAD)